MALAGRGAGVAAGADVRAAGAVLPGGARVGPAEAARLGLGESSRNLRKFRVSYDFSKQMHFEVLQLFPL